MRSIFGRVIRDDSGSTAIEYGLICAFIFLAIVATIQNIGKEVLVNLFDVIAAAFP